MSYKYIPQINNQNFVYPNNYLAEYDVDILQNINDNYVSGYTTGFTATTATSTGITITFYYNWSKNNADGFILQNGNLAILSVHCLAAGQTYYKPWRIIGYRNTSDTSATTYSNTAIISFTPDRMGLTTFVSGTYYFEVRFIGSKAIYPICQTLSITI